MTEPLVTYPAGSTAERTAVLAVTRVGAEVLFAVQRTPCHPESPRWPDQPADRCTVEIAGERTAVACEEGWLLDGELGGGAIPEGIRLPEDLDRPRDAFGCVVHRAPGDLQIAVGEEVLLSVDERRRSLLSRSHSRCHLVSLALNAALADAWRKDKEPPAHDSLGNPDFDKLAIVSSKIEEHRSVDVYRVGKHLRKAGFSVEAFSNTYALATTVKGLAQGWLLSSPKVSVTPERCALRERRTWSCALREGTASFPCGGTHPGHMEPDGELVVEISWDPQERHLAMVAKGGPLAG